MTRSLSICPAASGYAGLPAARDERRDRLGRRLGQWPLLSWSPETRTSY